MKKLLTGLTILLGVISGFGNDGVYITHGGVIYPMKETTISMDKEILSFKVRNGVAFVDIQFEFNNPENIERKLLVGFQAPTSGGDVSDSISNLNQITNFTIVQNNRILPYELKAAECEGCELRDPMDFHFSQSEQGIFVFLFEITFEPGLNRVQHSYSFPASNNVLFDQIYSYILTTGSKWAGGKIKDLTINFDMGENQYFYVYDIFGAKAEWSIVGSGKVTNEKFDYVHNGFCRMVRILSGHLQIHVESFDPNKNIQFGIISNYSFINRLLNHDKIEKGEILTVGELSLSGDYSKEELRLMRNTIYAQQGYDFRNPELKSYFSQFAWYIPDPNLKLENIVISEKESQFIEQIRQREKAIEASDMALPPGGD